MNILAIEDCFERIDAISFNSSIDIRWGFGRENVAKLMAQVIAGWQPDLICLDHDMPGYDGTEVVRDWGHILVNYPIIIWSWNADGARRMHFDLNTTARTKGIGHEFRQRTSRQMFGSTLVDWIYQLSIDNNTSKRFRSF